MNDTELTQQEREQRFASMMDAPEKYSEEELRAFFSQPENREDYRLFRLIQRAENRNYIDAPDAERAWNSFRQTHVDTERNSSERRIAWGAVWTGVAAAVVGILLCLRFFAPDEPETLVAFEYDDAPQLVVLQDDNVPVETFVQKDSVSFVAAAVPSIETEEGETTARIPMRTLSTPRGVDFKIILPDGTNVWLNAESSLQFPTAFTDDTRKVILHGEAYFKVARNEEAPFVVETEKMNVRVLGTEFNFRNYDSERPQVALINGSVTIQDATGLEEEIVLEPGQGACVQEDGRIQVLSHIDTYGAVQWINGYFYFRNRPLIEILQELGRWYNVGVVFENRACVDEKMHFSALRSADIGETINQLNHLLRVQITLEENDIVVR